MLTESWKMTFWLIRILQIFILSVYFMVNKLISDQLRKDLEKLKFMYTQQQTVRS